MKRNGYFRLVIILAIVTMLGAWAIEPASAATKTTIRLKIGSGHPLATDWIRFTSDFYCKEIVKRIGERTNYQLDLAEHWAGSVAKLGEELASVEIGILDMAAIPVPFTPTKLFLHNYQYNIPFFTGDPRLAARVNSRIYKEFPALPNEFKKYNQIYLGSSSVGDYNLYTTFPVRSIADVKGRKIAAAGPNLPWISGVGAVPVQSSLNEAYTSVQTGVYEGWLLMAGSVVSFKLHELFRYVTMMSLGAPGGLVALTINAKSWDKLPPEVRTILQEVANEYSVKQADFMVEVSDKGMQTMKAAGVKFFEMPLEEKAKWARMLINQPKKFAKEADAKGWPATAIMKATLAHATAEGYVAPRKWMEE
jgi:TRAP-type C4-dicarboxylate transport system substrate-binding protein